MKTKELIRMNRNLQAQLEPINEKYYGQLLIYMRMHSFLKDERKVEELLLEILQDMMDGQNQGISAEEYFGKQPQETADEMLAQLPVYYLDFIKMILFAFGVYASFSILSQFIFADEALDLGRLIIMGIYAVLFALVTSWFLGKTIYQLKEKMSKVLVGIIFVIGVLGGVSISRAIHTKLMIQLTGNLGIAIILLTIVVLGYWMFLDEDFNNWLPFFPIISSLALVGIFVRISFIQEWLTQASGKITMSFILLGVIVIQYLALFLVRKYKK